jgi:hypothetical protein
MKGNTLRKLVVYIPLGIIAGCGIVLGAAFVVFQSPSLLNWLANKYGYEVEARAISLSPDLSGSISSLKITTLHADGLTLLASKLTAKTSLDMVLRGEVDSLVLQNPRLTFRIGKETTGTSDLSFLQKLPNVRLLDIQNAEALLTLAEGRQQITLTGANVTLRNFSSNTGGSVVFRANFALTSAGETTIAASGSIKGNFQLTGVYPRPYGNGTLELAVDSGTIAIAGRTVSLAGLRLATEALYDRRTETVAITALRGESKDLGAIQGTAKAVLRGETPWSANLSVASIDFAQVFSVIKPFLPEEYLAWTMQGKGAVEAGLQGTYPDGQAAFSGTVTFSFRQGGFSSPDSTKAAQGVSGKIILKLQYVAPEQKLGFSIRSEEQDGEYLWGKYYSNLAGQKASLAADGALFLGDDPHGELSGSLDFFQTGDYSFSADARRNHWTLQVTVADVSHERLVDMFLKEYLKELSPDLAHLSVTGTSFLESVIRGDGAATTITGTYRMTGATFRAPDMQLAVQEMAVDLPFGLAYPPTGEGPPGTSAAGLIRIRSIQRRRLAIESLQIPLTIARNALEVPNPIIVPFFGGTIHLYGVQVDDVLFPGRYHFGVKIVGVDLGRMTRRLSGVEYPGVINADFGLMTYQNNRLTSEGKAAIGVFGGEIEASHFFAENIGSASRRIGGDIAFRDINLEEVTRKIAVGKMTGIIQGSLKHFVMEYGQPASFTLEVESVERRGVQQRISMDAIQSISILGTGADSSLNQGITRFFKEYPYSKIGLRCVLTNDQFSVNGTIHEGGKEYLVRRGFLRGVDVVNQNPDNVISFRDMAERLQRIARPPQAEPGRIQVE